MSETRAAYIVQTAEQIPPYVLSIPEAAAYLRVSERTFARWLKEGRVRKVRIDEGGRVTVRVKDLQALADAHVEQLAAD